MVEYQDELEYWKIEENIIGGWSLCLNSHCIVPKPHYHKHFPGKQGDRSGGL